MTDQGSALTGAAGATTNVGVLARDFAVSIAREFDQKGGTFAAFEKNGLVVVVGRAGKAEALRRLVRVHWNGRIQRGRRDGPLRADALVGALPPSVSVSEEHA